MKFIKKSFFSIFRRKSFVVYTAIFGDYDDLKNQEIKSEKYDLYCFTDNKNLKSKNFKIIYQKPTNQDSVRSAKIFKILPHKFLPQYEYSLWIDGSVLIKNPDLNLLIEKYLNNSDSALFKHPDRDCIYDELEACIKLKKDEPAIMKKQIEKYRNENYPVHNGLAACTIILRRHNSKKIKELGESWWNEIERGSKRDQLSFNYIAHRNNVKYQEIDGVLWDNNYFKILKHLK